MACGTWGECGFYLFCFKKTGFCTIEARILCQDRLTYCTALFLTLGLGLVLWPSLGQVACTGQSPHRRGRVSPDKRVLPLPWRWSHQTSTSQPGWGEWVVGSGESGTPRRFFFLMPPSCFLLQEPVISVSLCTTTAAARSGEWRAIPRGDTRTQLDNWDAAAWCMRDAGNAGLMQVMHA